MMTDPVFGIKEMATLGKGRRMTQASEETKQRNRTTFITKRDKFVSNCTQDSPSTTCCPYCKFTHDIENCQSLRKKDTEFRLKVVRE